MTAFKRLLQDPPPECAFEVSEAGIAFAQLSNRSQVGFQPLPTGAITVTPLRDNIEQPDVVATALQAVGGGEAARKRRKAVLILPDYCARIAVLEFDQLPKLPEEQLALVRFRMKKSVPFDIDAAAVSFFAQGAEGQKRQVVAAAVTHEILARYEALLRSAGFHPGLVTVSALASMDLIRGGEPQVLAKLTGRVLTVLVVQGGQVRLVRCVELGLPGAEEVLGVLYPTIAFVEDEFGSRPHRLLLCGFGEFEEFAPAEWERELGVPSEQLQSRFGVPGEGSAGLYGYLESLAA